MDRIFAILGLFTREAPEWSTAEIARELAFSQPTAGRLLRGLESHGFLMRFDRRHYRLGFAAVELGFRALHSIELRERLRPLLVRLAHQTGETCILGALTESRNAARVIDRIEGREALRITLEIGHTWPLHAGALAKVLLAHMPDRDAILEQPRARLARNTVTDHAELAADLARIRRVGWALTAEETEIGAWGVAAPLLDRAGMPVAAIGLVSPLERRSPLEEQKLVRHLQEAVAAATARLGLPERRLAPDS